MKNLINRIFSFIQEIIDKRKVIYILAKRDFQSQYMGSYFGIIWTFLQPLLFVLILYGVFSFGMKTNPSGEENFVLYLISGILAWFFFSEVLTNGTLIFNKFSFLIKQINFKLSLLPIAVVISTIPKHLFFICLFLLIVVSSEFVLSLYILQIFYYLFAMMFLLLGLCWTTASINVFANDSSKIVAVLLQFGFWLTPIFWSINLVPIKFQWVIKLNPVWYIVEGYRDSLYRQVGFWEKSVEAFYFWAIVLIINIIGIAIYKSLKPYFAEVI